MCKALPEGARGSSLKSSCSYKQTISVGNCVVAGEGGALGTARAACISISGNGEGCSGHRRDMSKTLKPQENIPLP